MKLKILVMTLVVALCSCTYTDPFGGKWEFDDRLVDAILFGYHPPADQVVKAYDTLEEMLADSLKRQMQALEQGSKPLLEMAERQAERVMQAKSELGLYA